MSLFRADHDSGFQDLIDRPDPLPLLPHIPKIAHYVHSRVQEQTWRDYATVRSALDHVGVSKVNIWVTEEANGELPGEMWERIQRLPNVTVREIPMPDVVFGKRVVHTEHTSDLVRMLAIFEEGGLYFDTDVMALKSVDDILYSHKTKSAVMARQEIPANAASNAMIMAKPGSPFIRRWMEKYKWFDPGEWDRTSCQIPIELWDNGDPDLTVLSSHTFMYPMRVNSAELGPDPELARMWLGKSWHDIDESYGLHMWKWMDNERHVVISPEAVRAIDTPIFCRMRKLFDNLDGDGYYSVPFREDPNCTLTWSKDLRLDQHMLFSDYQMSSDTTDIKWVDSSGHNLHGYAPKGTKIARDPSNTAVVRNFTGNSFAWLPVPSDWDSRVGTVRMKFQIHLKAKKKDLDWEHQREKEIGLFKIRIDYSGEVLISLMLDDEIHPMNGSYIVSLRFQWHTKILAWDEFSKIDDADWVSGRKLLLSDSEPNDLAVSYDRRNNGSIDVYMDGKSVSSGHLPLIASPKIGDEVWMNSKQWSEMDTGFRGQLHRFTMYADVVPPEVLAQPLSLPSPPASPSSALPALILIPLILLIIATMLRTKIEIGISTLRDMDMMEKLHNYLPTRLRRIPTFRYTVVADKDGTRISSEKEETAIDYPARRTKFLILAFDTVSTITFVGLDRLIYRDPHLPAMSATITTYQLSTTYLLLYLTTHHPLNLLTHLSPHQIPLSKRSGIICALFALNPLLGDLDIDLTSTGFLSIMKIMITPLIALVHYFIYRKPFTAIAGAALVFVCGGALLTLPGSPSIPTNENEISTQTHPAYTVLTALLATLILAATAVTTEHSLRVFKVNSTQLLLNITPVAIVALAVKGLATDTFPTNIGDVSGGVVAAVLVSGVVGWAWYLAQCMVVERMGAFTYGITFQAKNVLMLALWWGWTGQMVSTSHIGAIALMVVGTVVYFMRVEVL